MLKILLLISIIALSLNQVKSDLCEWQTKRDDLIAQLTPAGQNVTKQILKDLQYITGAAVQPIYEQVKEEKKSIIDQLMQTDKVSFEYMLNFIGYDNPSCGAGDLIDLCKYESDKKMVVNSFSRMNRFNVLRLFKAIDEKYFKVYPSLLAINRQLDDGLYQFLNTNEDLYVLEALAKLFM